MEKGQFKEEIKGRYCYICDNAEDILAPFMEVRKKAIKNLLKPERIVYSIGMGNLPYDLLIDLESFLLSDIPYEESKFYKEFSSKKDSPEFRDEVNKGIDLLKKHNDAMYSPYLQIKLDTWLVLLKVRQFIAGQKTDRENCVEKLHAMDEYFKIARYKNDGRIWCSGYLLKCMDVSNTINDIITYPDEPIYKREPGDPGLEAGKMVIYLTSKQFHHEENDSVLTEKEKQEIYLKYHDELPWDLDVACAIEDQAIPTLIELEMTRPDNTKPCGEHFYVKEEDIFVNPNDRQYRYYMLCPHCGYIVNIPSKEISENIKKRIEERCQKDPMLFRKKNLYSELLSLEDPITRKRLFTK